MLSGLSAERLDDWGTPTTAQEVNRSASGLRAYLYPMMRDGRMRKASFTNWHSVISPVPSRLG
jgi:hypothetical protein